MPKGRSCSAGKPRQETQEWTQNDSRRAKSAVHGTPGRRNRRGGKGKADEALEQPVKLRDLVPFFATAENTNTGEVEWQVNETLESASVLKERGQWTGGLTSADSEVDGGLVAVRKFEADGYYSAPKLTRVGSKGAENGASEKPANGGARESRPPRARPDSTKQQKALREIGAGNSTPSNGQNGYHHQAEPYAQPNIGQMHDPAVVSSSKAMSNPSPQSAPMPPMASSGAPPLPPFSLSASVPPKVPVSRGTSQQSAGKSAARLMKPSDFAAMTASSPAQSSPPVDAAAAAAPAPAAVARTLEFGVSRTPAEAAVARHEKEHANRLATQQLMAALALQNNAPDERRSAPARSQRSTKPLKQIGANQAADTSAPLASFVLNSPKGGGDRFAGSTFAASPQPHLIPVPAAVRHLKERGHLKQPQHAHR